MSTPLLFLTALISSALIGFLIESYHAQDGIYFLGSSSHSQLGSLYHPLPSSLFPSTQFASTLYGSPAWYPIWSQLSLTFLSNNGCRAIWRTLRVLLARAHVPATFVTKASSVGGFRCNRSPAYSCANITCVILHRVIRPPYALEQLGVHSCANDCRSIIRLHLGHDRRSFVQQRWSLQVSTVARFLPLEPMGDIQCRMAQVPYDRHIAQAPIQLHEVGACADVC